MAITAALVKELREKTGVGMMECKKALTENDGDVEKSILWLRERGLSRAAKKAGRVTAEGLVQIYVNDAQNAGVVLEVNCETDFVSKNTDFIEFCQNAAKIALENKANSIEELSSAPYAGSETVKDKLTNLISTIGENLNLRRVQVLDYPNGTVIGYSHMGGKIGALVGLDGGEKGEAILELGKDVAMHIAAASPRYLDSSAVSPDEIEQEKELAKKKLQEQNKPENLIEKILTGQINKFFKEICLVEQTFVKDPNLTIKKLINEKGGGNSIAAFSRFQLGEGIEKKQENFAEEVANQLK